MTLFLADTLCRLCAQDTPESSLISLLKRPITLKRIERLFPLQLFDLPGLPKKLCKVCCCRVDEYFAFYAAICAADRKLRFLLSNNLEVNEERDDPYIIDARVNNLSGAFVSDAVKRKTTEVACPHCLKFLDSKACLKNHVKTDHPNEAIARKYHCHICSKGFATKESRSLHESVHDGETPYLCDHCGKMFAHSNNLIKHISTHATTRKKFSCDLCAKSFLTRTFLKEHQNKHYGEAPFGCDLCGKKFHGRSHLRQHRWTHADRTFGCAFCDKSFKRKGNMAAHVKEFHLKTNGESGKPSELGKLTPRAIKNEAPIKPHKIAEKPNSVRMGLTCMKCRVTFKTIDERKDHNSKAHSGMALCNICGKQFNHSGSLTYHRRVAHTSDLPYQCMYCTDKFPIQAAATAHERKVHTGERPFVCQICRSSFLRAGDLRAHSDTHTDIRNFSCEFCGKLFRKKGSLTVHLKTHQGVKEHKCSYCGKDFVQKHDMLKHERTHRPDILPFFCKFCGVSFAKKTESAHHALCRRKALLGSDLSDLGTAEKILDLVVQDNF